MISALSLVACLFASSSQALQYAPTSTTSAGTSYYSGYDGYGQTQSNSDNGYSAYSSYVPHDTYYDSNSHTDGAWNNYQGTTTNDNYYQSSYSGSSSNNQDNAMPQLGGQTDDGSGTTPTTPTTGITPSTRDPPEWGFEITATFYNFDNYYNTIITDTSDAFKLYALGPSHQNGVNEGRLKLWIYNTDGTYGIQGNLEFPNGHIGDGCLVTEALSTYTTYVIRVEKHEKYIAMAVNDEWYVQVNQGWASTTMKTPTSVLFRQDMDGSVTDYKQVTTSKCSLFAANEAINN